MKVCAIISEYNPYHLGHKHHFEETMKEFDYSIVVMSGNFVQRGEPSIIGKYERANTAVKLGADLVVELPTIFSTSSAEIFAAGAINILDAIKLVDSVSFGSESGTLEELDHIASLIYVESKDYKHALKHYLKQGHSYPASRSKAISTLYGVDENILRQSNNILAIEYIKSLKRIGSDIRPKTIKRKGDTYNAVEVNDIASATAIRHLLKNKKYEDVKKLVPDISYHTIDRNKNALIYFDDIYKFVKHKVIASDKETLLSYQDVTEGMENLLKKHIHFTRNFDELFELISTKRYTKNKFRRVLLNIFLQQKKAFFKEALKTPPYLKVLAMNKRGTILLKEIKKANETLPIIVNNRKGFRKLNFKQKTIYLHDINSTLLYNNLITEKTGKIIDNDYQITISPF